MDLVADCIEDAARLAIGLMSELLVVEKISSATLTAGGATADMLTWWWVLMCSDTTLALGGHSRTPPKAGLARLSDINLISAC